MNNMIFTLFMMLLIVITIIVGVGYLICSESNNIAEQNVTNVVECEHDYVTTSRYSFLFNCYKTYSVCTKCGKEI